jgi:putative ABC transport system ATP-binding protein
MIKLESVNKTYKVGNVDVPILKDIDLSIDKGEYASIMGPSGSGKSTLMNIIGILDRPTRGHYIFNEENIKNKNQKTLASLRNQSIGFVFQSFHLLPRITAVENVELPLIYGGYKRSDRREKAIYALEKVGLIDHMKQYPNQLSGGQKQRVAIARAIINEPLLILADEPTGALDTKTGEKIMEIFTQFNKEGHTVVLVTHELEIAHCANRIINIRDGKIAEDRRLSYDEFLG